MTSAVRDTDLGLHRFLARARGMQSVKVSVGVHPEQAAQTHPSKQTIGEVAAAVEFGSGTKAPVPFLRATFDDERAGIVRELADAGAEVLMGAEPGKAFGAVAGKLRDAVRSRVPVDTGELRDHVEARVDGVKVAG